MTEIEKKEKDKTDRMAERRTGKKAENRKIETQREKSEGIKRQIDRQRMTATQTERKERGPVKEGCTNRDSSGKPRRKAKIDGEQRRRYTDK